MCLDNWPCPAHAGVWHFTAGWHPKTLYGSACFCYCCFVHDIRKFLIDDKNKTINLEIKLFSTLKLIFTIGLIFTIRININLESIELWLLNSYVFITSFYSLLLMSQGVPTSFLKLVCLDPVVYCCCLSIVWANTNNSTQRKTYIRGKVMMPDCLSAASQ